MPNEWLKMLPPLTDDDRRALDEIAPYFGHKCVHTLPTPIIFWAYACQQTQQPSVRLNGFSKLMQHVSQGMLCISPLEALDCAVDVLVMRVVYIVPTLS